MVRSAKIQAIIDAETVAVKFRAAKRAMEILLKGIRGKL